MGGGGLFPPFVHARPLEGGRRSKLSPRSVMTISEQKSAKSKNILFMSVAPMVSESKLVKLSWLSKTKDFIVPSASRNCNRNRCWTALDMKTISSHATATLSSFKNKRQWNTRYFQIQPSRLSGHSYESKKDSKDFNT